MSIKAKLITLSLVVLAGLGILMGMGLNSISHISSLQNARYELSLLNGDLFFLQNNTAEFLVSKNPEHQKHFQKEAEVMLQDLRNLKTKLQNENHDVSKLAKIERSLITYRNSFDAVVKVQTKLGFSEKLGLQGKLRLAVHGLEAELKKHHSVRILADMLMLRRNEKDFILRESLKYRDKHQKNLKIIRGNLDITTRIPKTAKPKLYKLLDEYEQATLEFIKITMEKKGTKTKKGLVPIMQLDALKLEQQLKSLDQEVSVVLEKALDQQKTNNKNTGAIISIFMLIIIAWIARGIVVPVNSLLAGMKEVSGGDADLTQRISINAKDEMGELATHFNSFLEKLQIMIQKMAVQTDSQLEASVHLLDASQEIASSTQSVKQKSVGITSSSQSVEKSVHVVAESAGQISSSFGVVKEAVAEVNHNINTIAASTEEASANMQGINEGVDKISGDITTVTASVEELSATMGSLSENTHHAMDISEKASGSADKTLEAMHLLDETSRKVGQIVSLIDNIAAQTNMLALNATIEAASAGEAGKGFAVVAAEVKTLAQQTANANSEIAEQIGRIQQETANALRHTESVSGVITELKHINTMIDRSIDEQNKAAVEIQTSFDSISGSTTESAQNIHELSLGLREITNSIGAVAKVTSQALDSVNAGSKEADGIAQASTQVVQDVTQVNDGIHSIQDSVDEVDRSITSTQEEIGHLNEMTEQMKGLVSTFKTEGGSTKNPPQALLGR